jgi:hypothetical protein
LCTAIVVLAACKSPTSYAPKTTTRFVVELTLADYSVKKVEIEIDLPEGYRQTSPGIHDAYFARPHDKVNFNVKRFSPNGDRGPRDPRPCGHEPGSVMGMMRLVHEPFGDRGELELCESRDEDGPMQYWVRGSVPVDDNWIECHGNMDGTETDHGDDASNYTEKQREQVLAVCRSMRIVSVGPPISIDEQRRALRR